MPRLYFGTLNASIVLRNMKCLDCTYSETSNEKKQREHIHLCTRVESLVKEVLTT